MGLEPVTSALPSFEYLRYGLELNIIKSPINKGIEELIKV